MIELIIGGSKSGKSMYSQHRAKELFGGQGRMIYLATMHPADREDRERIRRHVQDREGGDLKPWSGREILPKLPKHSVQRILCYWTASLRYSPMKCL